MAFNFYHDPREPITKEFERRHRAIMSKVFEEIRTYYYNRKHMKSRSGATYSGIKPSKRRRE
jgi:hypothetical protein